MEYINNTDFEYISNKYHDTTKPFDSFARFIRHDEIFDDATGMDGDKLQEQIFENDKKFLHLPHPIRKARAFEFVLQNTKIACDSRDRFPAINCIDRPLNSTIVKNWGEQIFSQVIPQVEERRCFYAENGVVTSWPDYDHSVPVWDMVFGLGFNGILEQSQQIRRGKSLTPEQDAFYEGIRITYQAIVDFIGRLHLQAKATKGSEMLADALGYIQHNPPKTFYQALLVDYLYFMLSEHIEGLQVRSLGNFDRLFYPFYISDIKNGVTQDQIRQDLAYFFMQFTAIGNYWNQPVFLGGEKADGSTEINELSYLFLDVYDKMKIYNPKIQIKVCDSTPKEFILKALDMIRRGHNCIVFVNQNTIAKALINGGATPEQARLCNVKGCYEYSVQGGMDTGMNYLNLLKPLEHILHGGKDGVTAKFFGRKCPDLEDYATFEQFYEEYKKQLLFVIDGAIETVNGYEEYFSYINPQSMLSATYPTCLEKGKDAFDGGACENGNVIMGGFLADLVDSLSAIKKFVFDQKVLTLKQFCEILDCDYQGHEKFRLKLLNDPDKYGNDRDLPDGFASDITSFIASHVRKKENAKNRGGRWTCGFHVARMSYQLKGITASSPNGRRRFEELSKNCSASMGQNKQGATAAILSVTKIDATQFKSDASLDLGLLPSAVKGEDGLLAMFGLLKTFVARGGHAIHINVFDADTLRDAQAHPERYQDLQVRVCGWNVLWNNINKVEQDGFIKQAEGLI